MCLSSTDVSTNLDLHTLLVFFVGNNYFLGEIIVKQIELNLIPKIFESSNSFDSEISLTEQDDKSKEKEESSNVHCPLKKSEVIEENSCFLQKKPAEYVNLNA
jgi:hypothetical protein